MVVWWPIQAVMKKRDIILLAIVCGVVIAARLLSHNFAFHFPAERRELLAACVPWIIFSLYWEAAAKNASAARSAESRFSRGVHLVLTNGALIPMLVPGWGLGRFLPISRPMMAAGLTVEVLGLGFAIWARRVLGRHWSGEITIKVDHELVRQGPYKLLRHPIYTGILAMYTGMAMVSGSWLALIGIAMAVFAYARKIRLEEANMVTAFGTEYDAYRHETWAVIPWMW